MNKEQDRYIRNFHLPEFAFVNSYIWAVANQPSRGYSGKQVNLVIIIDRGINNYINNVAINSLLSAANVD